LRGEAVVVMVVVEKEKSQTVRERARVGKRGMAGGREWRAGKSPKNREIPSHPHTTTHHTHTFRIPENSDEPKS
jgi:hypothetical protein